MDSRSSSKNERYVVTQAPGRVNQGLRYVVKRSGALGVDSRSSSKNERYVVTQAPCRIMKQVRAGARARHGVLLESLADDLEIGIDGAWGSAKPALGS